MKMASVSTAGFVFKKTSFSQQMYRAIFKNRLLLSLILSVVDLL